MNFTTSFFIYCPNCTSQNFSFENVIKFKYNNCQFEYYHNIAAAVAVVFTFEDEVLFTVRNEDPDKGMLDLPGGFIDPNENAQEAACREIKEELGIVIFPEDLKFVTTAPNNYLYKNVPYRTMDLFFEYSLKSKDIEVVAKSEIKELVWIKRNKIEKEKIGFVSIKEVVEKFYFTK